MKQDQPASPPKLGMKRLGRRRVVIGLAMLPTGFLLLWICLNVALPVREGKPLVRFAPDTTVISAPLNDKGDADYIEYLNKQQSICVTPENNAVVLLIQATGPIFRGTEVGEEFFTRLGVEPCPKQGAYLVEFDHWRKSNEFSVTDMPFGQWWRETEAQLDFALANPWSAEQFPGLATWLRKNRKPLDLVREASRRTRYYNPLIRRTETPLLISVDIGLSHALKDFADLLAISAMKHVHEGDVASALDDTLTIRRLARLLNQVSTNTIEQLISVALEERATKTEWRIAQSGKAAPQELANYLTQIAGLSPLKGIADPIDQGERFAILEAMNKMGRNDQQFEMIDESLGFTRPLFVFCADWATAARVINRSFDRLVSALKQETFAKQVAALDEIGEEMKLMQMKTSDPFRIALVCASGRGAKGTHMGELLTQVWTPSCHVLVYATWIVAAEHQLSQIVFALEIYKAKHGKYPKKLDDLIPEHFEKVPLDPFVEKPFQYTSTDDQYVLYSVGWDMTDDEVMQAKHPGTLKTDIHAEPNPQDWDKVLSELRDR